jgi:hypothetical protein
MEIVRPYLNLQAGQVQPHLLKLILILIPLFQSLPGHPAMHFSSLMTVHYPSLLDHGTHIPLHLIGGILSQANHQRILFLLLAGFLRALD